MQHDILTSICSLQNIIITDKLEYDELSDIVNDFVSNTYLFLTRHFTDIGPYAK